MEKANDWFWDWQGIQRGIDDESEEDVPDDALEVAEHVTHGHDKQSKKAHSKSDLVSRLAEHFPVLMEAQHKDADDGAQKEEVVQTPEIWVPDFFSQEQGSSEVVEMANFELSSELVELPRFEKQISEPASETDLSSPTSLPVSFGPGGKANFLSVDRGSKKDAQRANAYEQASQQESAHQKSAQESGEHVPPGSTSSTSKDSPMIEEASAPEKLQPDMNEPDDVVGMLGRLQLTLPVPSVSRVREARPLHVARNELWATQFVLHRTHSEVQSYMNEKTAEWHPHVQDSTETFGQLEDDGTPIIYQKNGIARIMDLKTLKSIKCDKTGAPGVYMEIHVIVGRLRSGKSRGGFAGAKQMNTRKMIKEHLFYTFRSCWLYLACQGPPGEFHPKDPGARIFIRRSAKDFRQFYFFEFPIAKQCVDLMEHENTILLKKFTYLAEGDDKDALVAYDRASLRSWQAYENEGKPPPDDAARMLVQAARTGHVNNLKQLVEKRHLDINLILTEFGAFGAGRLQSFTRSENAYAEERTALVAAIEAGWQSVVEAIIQFAKEGKANLNVVCSEWNPKGIGGPGLREKYTALDMARIYHRYELQSLLQGAGAKCWQDIVTRRYRPRENPFVKRARNDKGNYEEEDWFNEHESREEEFSFSDFDGKMEVDPEMERICKGLMEEMAAFKGISKDEATVKKFWKNLQLRWHPDKQPDDKKELGTRVFQWIQHQKDNLGWESKAWRT